MGEQGVVALRVPERTGLHLLPATAPRIFVHEGARQALERRLMAEFPGPVSLSITDNRHSIVSHSWQHGMLRARVHHMFLDAPRSVQTALVRYVAHSDAAASERIGRFIELNGGRLAPRSRKVPLHTLGRRHDLLAIYHDLNARYFGGSMHALITWGKRTRREPRQTIRLGSYASGDRLIRINPALDRNWVPKYFVQFVVYHEMLHHFFPSRSKDGGRRELHTPDFRDREGEFRHFDRAVRWEKSHLARLLRS